LAATLAAGLAIVLGTGTTITGFTFFFSLAGVVALEGFLGAAAAGTLTSGLTTVFLGEGLDEDME
jgi:hypothetical protein